MEMNFDGTFIFWLITFIVIAVDLAIRIVLLIHIPRNRKPTAAMAWLLTIFILPFFGVIIFLIFGSAKLSKHRIKEQRQINHLMNRFSLELKKADLRATIPAPYDIRADLAESLTALAPTDHNAVSILHGYDSIIEQMVETVNQAEAYVYAEFYAMTLDATTEPFFEALNRAKQRGVEVYVLFDTWGSHSYKGYKPMKKRLTEMGVQWRRILPISIKPSKYNRIDLRNHRKILVIDNRDAFIGSLNMIDKTYHRKDAISYIELVAHLQGPSVNEAAAVFASDWFSETGDMLNHFITNLLPTKVGMTAVQVVPSGPGYPYNNNLKLFVSFIQSARRSVVITNPYLVPDESLLSALTSASLRGIRVSILNSQAMDQWMVGHAQRSYYEELMTAGVTISLYKKPQLVHEKFMVIDDDIAMVGSSNFDIRSFELNQECIVVVYDPDTAHTLNDRHNELLQNSQRLSLAKWKQRSLRKNILDSIARLTSAFQ